MRGRNRRPVDRYPLAMVVGAIIVVVGVLTAIFVVGLGGVFHFLFSFLLPMALILLVVVGTIVLTVQGGAKVLDSRDQPSSASVRNHPRGGILSNPVYWLLMSLFLVASVAMACFFWLVIRDQWLHDRLLVAGASTRARPCAWSLCCWPRWRCRPGFRGDTTEGLMPTAPRLRRSSCWCSRCAPGWQR